MICPCGQPTQPSEEPFTRRTGSERVQGRLPHAWQRSRSPAPFSSSMRMTKYRLESVTLSTALPGNCSTGACANSSPGGREGQGMRRLSTTHPRGGHGRAPPRSWGKKRGIWEPGEPRARPLGPPHPQLGVPPTRGPVLQADEGGAAAGGEAQAAAPRRALQLPLGGPAETEGG